VLPTLVRPMRRTLKEGRWNPRKGTDVCSTLAQDNALTSDQRGVSPPSPSILCGHPAIMTPSRALLRHPRRCGSTGRQDAATPAAVHPMASCQRHPRVSVRTTTEREAPTPPPSKPLLDGYRARHDALPKVGFARKVVHSTMLYTISLHVTRIVWHDCKLPPLGL
jgi:hypothetical protein